MASGSFNDSNSQLNDSIDTISSKILSNEQEKSLKNSQMATKKLSNSIDVKPHLEDFDETQLKSLLDEALDYKSPRDANDKSDTFKQLLKNVTEEDMKHNERFNLGNYGMKQSNSLQNLFDDSHYQLNSHQSHTSSKKHHQRRKNSTSVSTRRLEGGSLPIDMHHSSAIQSPPDQPFLSEYKNKQKRKEKQQQKETVIDIGEDETDDRKLMQRHFDSSKDYISSSYPHDGIEMKSISYTNTVDLQVQDVSKYSSNPTSITTISSMTAAGGPPLATASIINPKVTTSTVTSSAIHNVDKIIEFPSLVEKAKSYQPQHQIIDVCSGSTINHNNNIVLANPGLNFDASSGGNGKLGAALQLNSSYNAVASLTSTDRLASSKAYLNKHENTSAQTLIQTAPMIAAAHNSGVVVNSKEAKSKMKRTPKTNETTVDVKSIQGFRGTDEIEDLLKYIEDGGGKNQRSHPKNGIVSSNQASDHLLSAEDKKKKIAAKNNKVNKLKKSNSMDELCSTGRQQQQQQEKSSSSSSTAANKIIQDVTLRSKSSNLTSGAKKGDKNEKSQQKRNERRSWGTEGLWSEAGVQVESTPSHDNQQQDEGQENESSSSSSSSGVQSDNITLTDTTLTFVNNAEPANAVVSETEFHVVTKKRKVKRKSTDNVDLVKTSNNLQSYNMKRDSNARPGSSKPYNDRTDVGSKNVRNSKPLNQDAKASTGKNRRKSTSSMPPSDDECSSDGGDSVQSLPIETTKTTSSQLLSTTIVASADHNNPSSTNNKSNKKNSNHPSSNHHQQQQQQQQQQKPATFSYADIAKTNATRNSGNNVTTSSTEKWPSISASTTSSSTSTLTTSHQNNNNNVIINDPFSIANFDAVVSNSLSNHHQQKSQQKSAPIITTNMMSFPELVETNNNKNKQLSSNQQPPSSSSSSSLENNSSGDNNVNEKPVNGLDAVVMKAFDTNNNNNNNNKNNNNNNINSNSNAFVEVDRVQDRTNNNSNSSKISYSQSLLENHQESQDSNGNNLKIDNTNPSSTTNGTVPKMTLTKSKSVDHNNFSSIEQYPALEKAQVTLGEVFSKPAVTFETFSTKSKQQKQIKAGGGGQGGVGGASEMKGDVDRKPTKKEKSLKKSLSVQNSQYPSNQSNAINCRPAVIILNDNVVKPSEADCGITFGFDINEHLLFGHQNGETCVTEVSLDTTNNNNNNCDIINTNLSSNNINNNLTNQTYGLEMYENFIAPQNIVIGDNHMMTISQSSPKQQQNQQKQQQKQQHHNNNALDMSNQSSSNDMGYLSSSFITSSASPATQKSSSSPSINDDVIEAALNDSADTQQNSLDKKKRIVKIEEYNLVLPEFIAPQPVKFNHDELVSFVSDEWTKVERNGVYFNGQ